jgi:hypothetical protein
MLPPSYSNSLRVRDYHPSGEEGISKESKTDKSPHVCKSEELFVEMAAVYTYGIRQTS